MSNSRWAQIAPLTGVGSVALLIEGVLTINFYDYLPSAEEVRAFYEANATRASIGAYLMLLSAILLLWFSGSLRSALRTAEGGTGAYRSLFVSSGCFGACLCEPLAERRGWS